jgi:hypothetical protein
MRAFVRIPAAVAALASLSGARARAQDLAPAHKARNGAEVKI